MSAVALPNHIPSAQVASYPVRGGNALRALVDGDRAFRRICEATDQARHSVWVTVAFLYPDFRMPDGRSFFDVLDQAAGRGVDVRALFWRTKSEEAGHFHGHAEDHDFLTKRGARFLARWDRAEKNYCQHQKSWLIDAGHESEIAFVGGINLDNPLFPLAATRTATANTLMTSIWSCAGPVPQTCTTISFSAGMKPVSAISMADFGRTHGNTSCPSPPGSLLPRET